MLFHVGGGIVYMDIEANPLDLHQRLAEHGIDVVAVHDAALAEELAHAGELLREAALRPLISPDDAVHDMLPLIFQEDRSPSMDVLVVSEMHRMAEALADRLMQDELAAPSRHQEAGWYRKFEPRRRW